MSVLLNAAIENARHLIAPIIPEHLAGKLTRNDQPHKFAALYRQLGVARMFVEGVPEPLFIGLMQGASAYAHGLSLLADEEKVTSRGGAFYDAVGGEYWDAAEQIARTSRMTPNPVWEHEDDFLFVAFLMVRYFLGPDRDDDEARAAHVARQRDMLDRWEVVLEGGADPGLDVCGALFEGDAKAFRDALTVLADERDANLSEMVRQGQLQDVDAAWYVPFWGQGLALLRLAERDGLETDPYVSMVPAIARVPSPFVYDPTAWRRLDIQPRRRP